VGVLGLILVKVKTKKVKPFLAHLHYAGLGRVKSQFQPGHDLLDLLQSILGVPLGPTNDHKVIGISHKFPKGSISFRPVHIQYMQVDIRKQGTYYPALCKESHYAK
jgi:hypothetical protein